MTKLLLRTLALLTFAVTILTARSAASAPFIPKCYNLPKYAYADSAWRYSHECHEGTVNWYVYIDSDGNWYLVGSRIMP